MKIYDGSFNFSYYQFEKKLITNEQKLTAVSYTKKNYPLFRFDPIPKELRPLVRIAHEIIAEEKTLIKPQRHVNEEESFYSYHYEDEFDTWGSPDTPRRRRFFTD